MPRPPRRRRPAQRPARPGCEPLESRDLLSVSVVKDINARDAYPAEITRSGRLPLFRRSRRPGGPGPRTRPGLRRPGHGDLQRPGRGPGPDRGPVRPGRDADLPRDRRPDPGPRLGQPGDRGGPHDRRRDRGPGLVRALQLRDVRRPVHLPHLRRQHVPGPVHQRRDHRRDGPPGHGALHHGPRRGGVRHREAGRRRRGPARVPVRRPRRDADVVVQRRDPARDHPARHPAPPASQVSPTPPSPKMSTP